jgi:hypothetical protein
LFGVANDGRDKKAGAGTIDAGGAIDVLGRIGVGVII